MDQQRRCEKAGQTTKCHRQERLIYFCETRNAAGAGRGIAFDFDGANLLSAEQGIIVEEKPEET